MKTKSSVQPLLSVFTVAVKKMVLRHRIKIAQQSQEAEELAAWQANHNAQWFKLQVGRLKFKLEDMDRVAKR